jgi:putative tryptophan/tyrosine transport system substrate-binding protein
MNRRRVLVVLLGAVFGRFDAARSRHERMKVVGILFDGAPEGFTRAGLPAFIAGLKEAGFVEGQNLAIEHRYADGNYQKLPALAAELVALNVDALYAPGLTTPTLAAATKSIPIVFTTGRDPVQAGWVASLNRPGGHITGFTFLTEAVTQKQLEMLHRIVPSATTIGLLVNPMGPDTNAFIDRAQEAAHHLSLDLVVAQVRGVGDLDAAFASISERHAGALIADTDVLLTSIRVPIIDLAVRHRLPAMSAFREFAVDGGLASYGGGFAEAARQAGRYVGRILLGAKPADLPVVESQKLNLVLNLKTAKAIGIEIPPEILVLADEAIE